MLGVNKIEPNLGYRSLGPKALCLYLQSYRPSLPLSGLRGEILEQENAPFSCHHEIKVPIFVDIGHRNLHPGPGAAAVLNHVAPPFRFCPYDYVFIPVQS